MISAREAFGIPDEIEPAKAKALPLPADCDQTAVKVEAWSHDGAMLACTCIVQHDGETVVRVGFPPDFRVLARKLGHDPYDSSFEGYLETLAKMAFRARGGR